MRRSLYVHLNRDGMKTLEPDSTSFETDGSFKLILENHGQPAHVHLHVDDSLAEVVSLSEPNIYVEAGDIEPIEVTAVGGRSGRGTIEISTGYGAEKATIDVVVADTGEEESMAEPDQPESGTSATETVEPREPADLSRLVLPGLFAAGGVLFAVALMVLVGDFAALFLGALALLVAIGAAGYLLIET